MAIPSLSLKINRNDFDKQILELGIFVYSLDRPMNESQPINEQLYDFLLNKTSNKTLELSFSYIIFNINIIEPVNEHRSLSVSV